jgi:hypothetical protein
MYYPRRNDIIGSLFIIPEEIKGVADKLRMKADALDIAVCIYCDLTNWVGFEILRPDKR